MVEICALFIKVWLIDQGNANGVWLDSHSHTAGPADSIRLLHVMEVGMQRGIISGVMAAASASLHSFQLQAINDHQ